MIVVENLSDLNWFTITDVDRLNTPALVVYPERVKHNIAVLTAMIDDVNRLRPHIKTHKCREAVALCMAAGINKFKCSTIAEADMLGECNAADVLLAYQPVGPNAERFANLIKAYPQTEFSCLIDNGDTGRELSGIAVKNNIQITVYIDINVGMNRTGILPDQKAFELYLLCADLPGIKIMGLHVYDGHIHEIDLALRTRQCNEAYTPVERLSDQLQTQGFEPVIVAGGTPTFPIHAKRPGVECGPGTFIYWDYGYQQAFKEQEFLPAALIVGRVISLPDDDLFCVDIGHKAVASENVLNKRIYFLNAPHLTPVSHSEEHMVLDAGTGHHYRVGDVLYGLPQHICPSVALHDYAVTVENHYISGQWQTVARSRKINY